PYLVAKVSFRVEAVVIFLELERLSISSLSFQPEGDGAAQHRGKRHRHVVGQRNLPGKKLADVLLGASKAARELHLRPALLLQEILHRFSRWRDPGSQSFSRHGSPQCRRFGLSEPSSNRGIPPYRGGGGR